MRSAGKTIRGIRAVVKWAQEPNQQIVLLGESPIQMMETVTPYLTVGFQLQISRRRIVLDNGTIIHGRAAGQPYLMRGEMYSKAWLHDLCPRCHQDAFHLLRFALRLGKPELVATECGLNEDTMTVADLSSSGYAESLDTQFREKVEHLLS